jgi:hypothetical protein
MAMTHADKEKYIREEFGSLLGKKILAVRPMFDQEIEDFGWDTGGWNVPFVLILDDGTAVIPSQDPEGNGCGHLFIEQTTTEEDDK